jgi:hypothetical protein
MGILEALGKVGNVLDLPGSSLRDVLMGENPFDQWGSMTSGENRSTGRDLLRHYNLAGEEDTTLNFLGGLLTEMAVDPLNLIGGALVGRAPKAAAKARASNVVSREQRAAGFMPAEIAEKTVASNREGPVRFLHGTGKDFFRPDPDNMSDSSVMGWGHYMAEEGVPESAEDLLSRNVRYVQSQKAKDLGLPLSERELDDLAERLTREENRLEPYGDWIDEPWLTRPEGEFVSGPAGHSLYEPRRRPTHYTGEKGRAGGITEGYSGYETEKYKAWGLQSIKNEDVVDMAVPFFSKVDNILQKLGPEGKAASDQLSEASVKILDKIGPDAQRTWPGISSEFQEDVYKDVLQPAMDAIKERAYRGNTEYTLPDNAREWLVDSQMQLRELYDNAFTVEFGPQTQTRYVDIRKPYDVTSTSPEVLTDFSDELGDWAEEVLGERLPMSFEDFTRTRDLGVQAPYRYLNEFLLDLPRSGPEGLGLGDRLEDVLSQGAFERGHSRHALHRMTGANARNQLLHELGYDAITKPTSGIWAVMNPEDIYLPYIADAIQNESAMSPLGMSLLGLGALGRGGYQSSLSDEVYNEDPIY